MGTQPRWGDPHIGVTNPETKTQEVIATNEKTITATQMAPMPIELLMAPIQEEANEENMTAVPSSNHSPEESYHGHELCYH